MDLIVNGKELQVEQESPTLMTVIGLSNLDHQHVIIEYNGDLIPKDRYDSTYLKPQDKIEILTFMGGGEKSKFSSNPQNLPI